MDLNQVDILIVDIKQYRSACCALMGTVWLCCNMFAAGAILPRAVMCVAVRKCCEQLQR